MTGPEHYKEAQNWLNSAAEANPDAPLEAIAMSLTFAQVHATLALAAATVEQTAATGGGFIDRIGRPCAADPDTGEAAYLGTPWGRALYGEVAS